MELRVTPPLSRTVSRLDAIIDGPSTRVSVRVPVSWVEPHD
jgi:hypothetical protein